MTAPLTYHPRLKFRRTLFEIIRDAFCAFGQWCLDGIGSKQ